MKAVFLFVWADTACSSWSTNSTRHQIPPSDVILTYPHLFPQFLVPRPPSAFLSGPRPLKSLAMLNGTRMCILVVSGSLVGSSGISFTSLVFGCLQNCNLYMILLAFAD